jgi:hypothetical protein
MDAQLIYLTAVEHKGRRLHARQYRTNIDGLKNGKKRLVCLLRQTFLEQDRYTVSKLACPPTTREGTYGRFRKRLPVQGGQCEHSLRDRRLVPVRGPGIRAPQGQVRHAFRMTRSIGNSNGTAVKWSV